MSVNSCMSSMSVSINGQEVILEAALDNVFKSIQEALISSWKWQNSHILAKSFDK